MNPTPPEPPARVEADSADHMRMTVAAVFLDNEGLRPIWSIGLFLAIWALLRQIILPVAQAFLPSASAADHLIPARSEYIVEFATLLCVAVATWLMSRLESRPIATYGFSSHRSVRNFAAGIGWGTALLSLLVFCLHTFGLLAFDARLLFRGNVLRYALIWAIGFVLVGLAEEMLLRGYLQFTLTRALDGIFRRLAPSHGHVAAFWTSALLLSIAFGAIHLGNSGESPIGLLAAALVGLIFCLSLWRTGSLWWAIGFHAAWDWAQSFLYGVPDSGLLVQGRLFATHPTGRAILSGGLTGPEGSALILPILLAACVAVLTSARHNPPHRRLH